MAKLPALTPAQVVQVQDALLANADRLLNSALAVLNLGNLGLARSLAILGLEESGKAVALHRRRVEIAYEPEGSPFINTWLEKLWGDHRAKLSLVHDFLVDEDYWFDTDPPDPEVNRALLGEIEEWTREHNTSKQRGFYVDVDEHGEPLSPDAEIDENSLRQVIEQVHQIGWQVRLGEHIEAKRQEEAVATIPPATEEEIREMQRYLGSVPDVEADGIEQVITGMREGRAARKLNNDGYRLSRPDLKSNPFANLGRPGYEAETRELLELAGQIDGEGDNRSEES